MSYDSVAVLAQFHGRQTLGYPLLSDEKARHVNAFGVRNLEYPMGHRAYGIPHPGILMLAADGRVKAKFAVPGYRDRPPLQDLHSDLVAMMESPQS